MNAPASFPADIIVFSGAEGRKATRRMVDFAASIRATGSTSSKVKVADLSALGFRLRGRIPLEPAAELWLKVTGFPALRAQVSWTKGIEAGCKFSTPLKPILLEKLLIPPTQRRPLLSLDCVADAPDPDGAPAESADAL